MATVATLDDSRCLVTVRVTLTQRRSLQYWKLEASRCKVVKEANFDAEVAIVETGSIDKAEAVIAVTKAGEWVALDAAAQRWGQGVLKVQGERIHETAVSFNAKKALIVVCSLCHNALHQLHLTLDSSNQLHCKVTQYRISETHWPCQDSRICHLALVRGQTVDYCVLSS